MITPRNPPGDSPEDDPTGVRALLSSLPEPEPMPAYLVDRISASLAAEQASRSLGLRHPRSPRSSAATVPPAGSCSVWPGSPPLQRWWA